MNKPLQLNHTIQACFKRISKIHQQWTSGCEMLDFEMLLTSAIPKVLTSFTLEFLPENFMDYEFLKFPIS